MSNQTNEIICAFGHNSKHNYQLSRFYEADVTVGEHTYPSIEHAFQALRCEDKTDWLKGGKYSDWDYVLSRVNEASKSPINGKNLKKKHMVGALAHKVANRPLMFRLKQKDLQWTEELLFPMLEDKFKGELLDILLKTEGTLLDKEHQNMGHMLTKFRDSKRKVKRSRDIEIGETLSFNQALNKRFKRAEEEGIVIEIKDEDGPWAPHQWVPHQWDSYSDFQKFKHALDNDWSLAMYHKHIQHEEDPTYSPTHNPNGLKSASGIALNWNLNAVNLQGLQLVASKAEGLGKRTKIYPIEGSFQGHIQGYVLVVKDFIPEHKRIAMQREILNLPHYDTKHWVRGKCIHKSRWTFQLTDRDLPGNILEPNKDLRTKSECNFERTPACKDIRNAFNTLGVTVNLKAQGDIFGVTNTETHSVAKGIRPRIGNHIATNIMGTRQLCLCAFHNAQPIGSRTQIQIEPGDMYIMDHVAAGTSLKGHHIRHWASGGRGDKKFIDRVERTIVKKIKAFRGELSEEAQYIKFFEKQSLKL